MFCREKMDGRMWEATRSALDASFSSIAITLQVGWPLWTRRLWARVEFKTRWPGGSRFAQARTRLSPEESEHVLTWPDDEPRPAQEADDGGFRSEPNIRNTDRAVPLTPTRSSSTTRQMTVNRVLCNFSSPPAALFIGDKAKRQTHIRVKKTCGT